MNPKKKKHKREYKTKMGNSTITLPQFSIVSPRPMEPIIIENKHNIYFD
jgi:hypothetical protein